MRDAVDGNKLEGEKKKGSETRKERAKESCGSDPQKNAFGWSSKGFKQGKKFSKNVAIIDVYAMAYQRARFGEFESLELAHKSEPQAFRKVKR